MVGAGVLLFPDGRLLSERRDPRALAPGTGQRGGRGGQVGAARSGRPALLRGSTSPEVNGANASAPGPRNTARTTHGPAGIRAPRSRAAGHAWGLPP